ncbi:M-phase inducer phosphatase [Erysiphe necator]|uniref:M-phase inducer phosphatase n=1 Tax=Uncinula necator TaxID=52586 RepID=A0A0B1PH60_UNCNE|nr:M-phase inducer phosphatase [Erysiphe necator]KHJ35844.1 putative m-phase inducer phosphatase [Erysiphe necator]
MEASSPLAALRAPCHIPTWGGSDMFSSHSHNQFASNIFGPGAFNFQDLPIKKSGKPDYLKNNQNRGCSPTASLAADLSQNFHIDMSPQLPTPRRSLFTSNLFGSINTHASVATPHPFSSHMGGLDENMEISPLPHKQPRYTLNGMKSPTPGNSQQEKILPSSPPQHSHLGGFRHPNCGVERKKSLLARSGMSRGKSLSVNLMPSKKSENQPPPFLFGAGTSKLSSSTSISLDECFLDSPPRETHSQSSFSPRTNNNCPPRLGKPFGSANTANTRLTGSPVGHSSKRPSNPMVRPRKQFRRSLSMFEHPDEMIKSKQEEESASNLHTVIDIDELQKPVLPHFFQEGSPDSIPRISQETFLQILDGEFTDEFERKIIVDCRFEYEFEGGHIDGAVNYNDKELLAGQLFGSPDPRKTLLIFHCEYSAHRAPIMARHIRKQDRACNIEQYPRLTYPEIYILDGGYSAFYARNRNRCFPQNYIEMGDKDHTYTCEREMGRLRQNRTKFSRAQTFAFGQSPIDDSPTAPNKCRNLTKMDIEMNGVISPISSRRLVSY